MPEEEKKSIMNSTIDVKWLVTLLVPFIAWCISIEVRMSSGLPQRVTNLEIALQPVLIDYGVDKELEARGVLVDKPRSFTVPSPTLLPKAKPVVTSPLTKEEQINKFRLEQEMKLKQQFPNAYQEKK